ncbi:MAG: hypothetical protein KDD22_02365 [Bdellovibrionales bacterium]|nr:hypothetical protein [Bdellovibrionales bacterium]
MGAEESQEVDLRWACLGQGINPLRYELLSEFMSSHDLSNTFEYLDTDLENFEANFVKAQKEYDQIRIERPFAFEVVKKFKSNELLMTKLSSADTVFKDEQNKWWCRSAMYLGFSGAINALAFQIDRSSTVFIIGSGSAARVSVLVCWRMGFKNFIVSGRNFSHLVELKNSLQKNLLGIRIECIPYEKIIQLPGETGLVINATPHSDNNEVVQDLYYFNYMKKNGLLVDLNFSPRVTPLIQEYLDIYGEVIYGNQVAAYSDAIWIKWVLGKDFDPLELSYIYREGIDER